jgi:hypothetical protein
MKVLKTLKFDNPWDTLCQDHYPHETEKTSPFSIKYDTVRYPSIYPCIITWMGYI